jgi:uncharacterized membrane protein YidH (DUF202 family)
MPAGRAGPGTRVRGAVTTRGVATPENGAGRRQAPLEDTGDEPDPRFTLANERTFLAWTRTTPALMATGLAVVEFLHSQPRTARLANRRAAARARGRRRAAQRRPLGGPAWSRTALGFVVKAALLARFAHVVDGAWLWLAAACLGVAAALALVGAAAWRHGRRAYPVRSAGLIGGAPAVQPRACRALARATAACALATVALTAVVLVAG